MNQKIFYQSSLPRSGSTLLQNIVGQNPQFYVTPTSGMIDLMLGARIGYNENKEAEAWSKDLWNAGFYSFCREGMKGYCSVVTDKPYILDKSRAWGPYYSLLNNINPNPKIVMMVRDLRAVFASMEKKFRQNPDYDDGLLNNRTLQNITTQQRVETWAHTHPIGYAVMKLHQSILDKTAGNFLFIRYEDLCTNPQSQLNSLYRFFEIQPFQHNFDNIPQVTFENDTVHGIYGDHIIRNRLEMLPNDYDDVLGKMTSDWIYNQFKWFFDIFGYSK
jgi:sulfotransferase